MIPAALHLISCLALAGAALFWKRRHPSAGSCRFLLPFIVTAVFFACYGGAAEWFIASYSGAIYEMQHPSRSGSAWMAAAMILSLLPTAGLIPAVGRRASWMAVIGLLASVPGAAALVRLTG